MSMYQGIEGQGRAVAWRPIRDGMAPGRFPCDVAWVLAKRFRGHPTFPPPRQKWLLLWKDLLSDTVVRLC
jgi:hypothetical protein